jgi:hypothetical protein
MKEWTVLHKNYQTGEVREIGRVLERRRAERGKNFIDLIRKARLNYGKPPLDIGAIFLGSVVGDVKPCRLRARRLRLISK